MPTGRLVKTVITLLVLIFIFAKKDYLLNIINPQTAKTGPLVDASELYQGVSYEPVNKSLYDVSILADKLLSPTRIKITPDGKHLLVTQLTGELMSLDRDGDGWGKPYLVSKIDTKFPGFPPDEAGLVGEVFSENYSQNGKIFLLYTFKDKDGKIQNRISSLVLKEKNGKLTGSNTKLIFQANIAGNSSHQITDGVSVNLNGETRLAFLIGEGFDGKRSQDPNLEAGKLMSIKEDGSDHKIHALGIRNGYTLAINPNDNDGKILISDTGPDKYDRLIYTNPFLGTPVNFGWDGNQEKLANPIPDPNFPNILDMVIFRYPETRTFTGLAFREDGQVLVTLFGKTGFKDNTPGKEILLGKMTNLSAQPKVSFTTIIKRVKESDGKLGNPLGMEIDNKTNDFFFLDVMEGRIYQVKEKTRMEVNK